MSRKRVHDAIHRPFIHLSNSPGCNKAASLAGVSFDRMKALMLQRGVQLRLGPVDDAEIREEVAILERLLV